VKNSRSVISFSLTIAVGMSVNYQSLIITGRRGNTDLYINGSSAFFFFLLLSSSYFKYKYLGNERFILQSLVVAGNSLLFQTGLCFSKFQHCLLRKFNYVVGHPPTSLLTTILPCSTGAVLDMASGLFRRIASVWGWPSPFQPSDTPISLQMTTSILLPPRWRTLKIDLPYVEHSEFVNKLFPTHRKPLRNGATSNQSKTTGPTSSDSIVLRWPPPSVDATPTTADCSWWLSASRRPVGKVSWHHLVLLVVGSSEHFSSSYRQLGGVVSRRSVCKIHRRLLVKNPQLVFELTNSRKARYQTTD